MQRAGKPALQLELTQVNCYSQRVCLKRQTVSTEQNHLSDGRRSHDNLFWFERHFQTFLKESVDLPTYWISIHNSPTTMSIEGDIFVPEAQTLANFSIQKIAEDFELNNLNSLDDGGRRILPIDERTVEARFGTSVDTNSHHHQNFINHMSYLQAQDDALARVMEIFTRMSELKVKSMGVARGSEEMTAYEKEFKELLQTLAELKEGSFNGEVFFSSSSKGGEDSRGG